MTESFFQMYTVHSTFLDLVFTAFDHSHTASPGILTSALGLNLRARSTSRMSSGALFFWVVVHEVSLDIGSLVGAWLT